MSKSASAVVLAVLLLAISFRGDTEARSVRANDRGTPTEVAIDANGVEEPATIALSRFGVTHQVTAFIRRVSVPPAVFHVRDEWVYRGSNGVTGSGQFALPGGYTDSSDPVLVASGSGQVYDPESSGLSYRSISESCIMMLIDSFHSIQAS